VTRPRTADDFPLIRARMEELRRVTRARAADDFVTIRSRMEELRRERAQAAAGNNNLPPSRSRPRPYAVSARPILADRPGVSPAVRRAVITVRTA
jgi:hypothetical protein